MKLFQTIALFALLAQPVAADIQLAQGVSLSGDIRERATYVSALNFDSDAADTGWFWTQRILASLDIGMESGLSGRISLLSGLQSGIDTTPIEDNHLALQEAFFVLPAGDALVKVGRQEIKLGSQRLIGWRDGTNVRRNWDGMRIAGEVYGWQVDAFGFQLVEVEPEGAFNDQSRDDRQLAGLYATGDVGISDIDVYYLFSGKEDMSTIAGVADQDRHSVGARLFGEHDSWFWNWEAVYQFGDHGDADISAWTLAANTGYRIGGAWSTEVMLSANIASGDSDPEDNELETFDALYPRANYFSEAAQLAPANFYNLNPYLMLYPRDNLYVSLDVNFYWRLEREDGVYGPPGVLIRPPGGSRERFVNTAVSLAVEWDINDHWFMGLAFTHSRPEEFIEETGPSDNANFIEFTVQATL